MSAKAIRRLAVAVGPDAAGKSAEGLVDYVIEQMGLKLPKGYRDVTDSAPAQPDEQDITAEEAAARNDSTTRLQGGGPEPPANPADK